MAESLFRKLAKEQGFDAEARSAGVSAINGAPMSRHSATVLKKRGIKDGHSFQSSELTAELVEWADTIFTMTSQHKRYLLEAFPQAVEKTYTLKEFAYDNPDTVALLRDREALIADLQLKMALNQPVTMDERNQVHELERKLPDFDIGDPIGGPLQTYEAVAQEMEEAIRIIIRKYMN